MSRAHVWVMPKRTVLDPQGEAVRRALESLGFGGVTSVRQGKFFELELAGAADPAALQAELERMCDKLLANTVIEDYRVEIAPASA